MKKSNKKTKGKIEEIKKRREQEDRMKRETVNEKAGRLA